MIARKVSTSEMNYDPANNNKNWLANETLFWNDGVFNSWLLLSETWPVGHT